MRFPLRWVSVSACVALPALVPLACSGAEGGAMADAGSDAGGSDAGSLDGPLSDTGSSDADAAPPPLVLTAKPFGTLSNAAIVRVEKADEGFVVVEETTETRAIGWSHPRRVRWLDAGGAETRRYEPPAGEILVDAAAHPSGDVTALVLSNAGWRARRLLRDAAPLDVLLTPAPWIAKAYLNGVEGGSRDAPSPAYTARAGALVAQGEGVVIAYRTGRNTVVNVRLPFDGVWSAAEEQLGLTGEPLFGTGLLSGSFDVFSLLDGPFQVHAATGAGPEAFFGVTSRNEEVALFNLASSPWLTPKDVSGLGADALVWRNFGPPSLGVPSGAVVGTRAVEDVTHLRGMGSSLYVFGRTAGPRGEGLGWDGFVAKLDAASFAPVYESAVDVDRGDVFFDGAEASQGHLVAVGSCGYRQNPSGASISEDVDACVVVLDGRGAMESRVLLPKGPRHNQVRSIVALGGDRFLVGGMTDGPGTHSADADPSLAASKGVLWILEPAAGAAP